MKIGVKVTLRGERMYEFMDKLFSFALPRVRVLLLPAILRHKNSLWYHNTPKAILQVFFQLNYTLEKNITNLFK